MHKFWPFVERHWFLSALFVILFFVIMFYERFSQQRDANTVSPQEAVHLINKKHAIIIDMRNEKMYASGHIVGSRQMTLEDLKRDAKKMVRYKNKPFILIGLTQLELGSAAKLLKAQGIDNVQAIKGGLKAWRDANLPLEKGEK